MKFGDFVLQNEPAVRLGFFLGIFILMAVWELLAPRKALTISKALRWSNNIGLVLINTIILRLLFPAGAIGVAAFVVNNGWGLLNYYSLPPAIAVLLSVVAMDFVIYLQHVMVHAIPLLWRLHRVHHADLDFDLTTGSRFHSLEIILSMLIKFATIIVIGPPIIAVVIFEVILNGMAMFNHANVKLPLALDRVLRLILVTPDMHRVHHSIEENEANSNYGFNLAIWDRIFGTYIDQPRAGHDGMTIGIHQPRDPKQVTLLPGMLAMPFVGKITAYAINRRKWNDQEDK